jgi:hypothetical protein
MRSSSLPTLIALVCFGALGSGGCLLLTPLSGFSDAQTDATDAAPVDAGPDAPAADADAAAQADAGGVPAVEIVAHDDPGITAIAVHSDGLYYVRPQAQTLYRVVPASFGPTARGTPLITGLRLQGVAVTALDVFIALDAPPSGDACVLRAKHDGSGVAPVTGCNYCVIKGHPVTSPASIFFLGVDSGSKNGVWHVETASGGGSRSYYGSGVNNGEILTGVAYGGANLFVSDQGTTPPRIATVTSTAPPLSDFAPAQNVIDMAADAMNLYWITRDGSVRSLAASTPNQPPREIAKLTAPQRIAIDETSLYVTTSGLSASSGTLVRIAKDTGDKTELAKGLANPSAIVVDTTAVYWANVDDGTIMRVAKK